MMTVKREKWTQAKVDKEVSPLLKKGWSVQEMAKALGMSRQRLYKILSDLKKEAKAR